MKTTKNIFIAFILNLAFSIFEFIGGLYTGSIAIISDAMHDIGDAASIGISFFLEKTSTKQPDSSHTYGYLRYSVMGSLITTVILLFGSAAVIYNAAGRIISPSEIKYNPMIAFAVAGVLVNLLAAFFTRDGDSLNQKSVNLHMLEDVLGWAIVLIGAVVMKFTDFVLIDPILSICAAVFIISGALRNLKEITGIFLEKTPRGINIDEVKQHIQSIDGVSGVHHIHIWSMDGQNNYATMHIVTNADSHSVKENIRKALLAYNIRHTTLELEAENEACCDEFCRLIPSSVPVHHHHHH